MATNAFAAGAYSSTLGLTDPAGKKKTAKKEDLPDFSAMIRDGLDAIAQSGKKAETQAMAAAGGKGDLVDVVTAVAETEAALETLVAVRDRVIAAYEQIMQMPV